MVKWFAFSKRALRRINEAHQDPNIPVELDLRRNIVKRIAELLESKHMKRVLTEYV